MRAFIQGGTADQSASQVSLVPMGSESSIISVAEATFEPICHIPLILLGRKLAFLIAISSARRVSELEALSCKEPNLVCHKDKIVLRPHPAFLPKVVSSFHLNQDIVLPSFFSGSADSGGEVITLSRSRESSKGVSAGKRSDTQNRCFVYFAGWSQEGTSGV